MWSCSGSLFALILVASVAVALKLPSYLTPCKRNDPNLDDCVVKNGQAAIPKIINGDPKYRAPKLDPMEIIELRVNQGTRQVGLRMVLKNAKIYGLKATKFIKANIMSLAFIARLFHRDQSGLEAFLETLLEATSGNNTFCLSRTDLKGRHIEWVFKIPRLEIQSDYDVSGQVLILPITGTGKANVTLTKLDINYKYDWELIEKNGKEYMNFTSSSLLFENGRTYFDLKNLFNGDPFLGNNMNRFLNENWKEVTRELGPAVGQAFSDVFRILLTNVAAQVPFDEIYT